MGEMYERLRVLRKILSLTYREVSSDIGIPISSISKYEKGLIKPGVETLEKIVNHYDINLNWLITGNGAIFTNPKYVQIGNKEFYIKIRLKKYFNKIKMLVLSNDLIDELDNIRSFFLQNPEKVALEIAKRHNKHVVVEYYFDDAEPIIKVYNVLGQVKLFDKQSSYIMLDNLIEIFSQVILVSFDLDKLKKIDQFVNLIVDQYLNNTESDLNEHFVNIK